MPYFVVNKHCFCRCRRHGWHGTVSNVQEAKVVLEENNVNTENVEGPGRPDQSLIFQTGSGKPVLVSERSIERSRAVLMDEGAENIGQGDTGCQLPVFQTGLN
ncbi:unnamed protein product [Urochloa humidicola]